MKFPSATSLLGIQKEENPNKDVIKAFDPDKLPAKKVHLTWEAPSRPDYKKSNNKISRTFLIIGVFIGLLLAVMGEYPLILLIASLIFVNFALKKASPEKVTHEINTHGFVYAGQIYYWHQLKNFFFLEDNLLVISTYDVFPGRLFVLFTHTDKKKIKDFLVEYIHYLEEAPKTSFEKAYDSVLDKLKF